MRPLNCRATDKCQIDISETPGYKKLLRNIIGIVEKYESVGGKLPGKRKLKKERVKKK